MQKQYHVRVFTDLQADRQDSESGIATNGPGQPGWIERLTLASGKNRRPTTAL